MDEKKVEFLRVRDFGQVISDVFVFIRQESRPLLRSFLAISGSFILLSAILSGLTQFKILRATRVGGSDMYSDPASYLSSVFGASYFLALISTIVLYTAVQTVVFSYVKLYVVYGNTSPSIEQVWDSFKKYFLRVFIFGILTGLMMAIGFVFCLLPGIYLAVVLTPLSAIVIVEDADIGEAIGRCFYLIKQNFWISLFIYLIAFVIFYIISMILGALAGGIFSLLSMLTTSDINSYFSWITSFAQIFASVFYLIPLLAIAFHYFSLREKTEGLGIMNRIDQIGQQPNRPGDTGEEEY